MQKNSNKLKKLKEIIEGGPFLIYMLILSIISVILTAFELMLPNGNLQLLCINISSVITIFFVVELILRFYFKDNLKKFFLTSWLEIIAVIPYTRSLRTLRLLRLLRVVSIGMRGRRQQRFKSFGRAFSENIITLTVIFVVIISATIGIAMSEKGQQGFSSIGNAFVWTISTLTAGEPIYAEPTTIIGKLITYLLMLGSLTLFAVITGTVSAHVGRILRNNLDFDYNLLKNCEGHYIICGWNQLTPRVVSELRTTKDKSIKEKDIVIVTESTTPPSELLHQINKYDKGKDLIKNSAGVRKAKSLKQHWNYMIDKLTRTSGETWIISADHTSAEVLSNIKVECAQAVLLLAGDESNRKNQDKNARTILTKLLIDNLRKQKSKEGQINSIHTCIQLLNIKQLDNTDYLMAPIQNEDKKKNGKLIDSTYIIELEKYVGHLIAHSILVNGLRHVFEDVLTSSKGVEIKSEKVTNEGNNQEKSFQSHFRAKQNKQETLIGYFDSGEKEYKINPAINDAVPNGSRLLFIAETGSKVKERAEYLDQSKKVKKVVICGWSNAVPLVIDELLKSKSVCKELEIILLTEKDRSALIENHVEKLRKIGSSKILKNFSGDYTAVSTLKAAGIEGASHAIVFADRTNLDRSSQDVDARVILCALSIERLNAKIHTCVELIEKDPQKTQILKSGKVEDIICGFDFVSNMIAQSAKTRGLGKVFKELLTADDGSEFKKESLKDYHYSQILTNESITETNVNYGHVVNYFFKQTPSQIVVGITRKTDTKDITKVQHLVNLKSDDKIKKEDEIFLIHKGNS